MRKGKTDGASEEDMDTVIAVHNNMNETTWQQVRTESMYDVSLSFLRRNHILLV